MIRPGNLIKNQLMNKCPGHFHERAAGRSSRWRNLTFGESPEQHAEKPESAAWEMPRVWGDMLMHPNVEGAEKPKKNWEPIGCLGISTGWELSHRPIRPCVHHGMT